MSKKPILYGLSLLLGLFSGTAYVSAEGDELLVFEPVTQGEGGVSASERKQMERAAKPEEKADDPEKSVGEPEEKTSGLEKQASEPEKKDSEPASKPKDVQPIYVPPPKTITTVGRDGKRWVVIESAKESNAVQDIETPVAQSPAADAAAKSETEVNAVARPDAGNGVKGSAETTVVQSPTAAAAAKNEIEGKAAARLDAKNNADTSVARGRASGSTAKSHAGESDVIQFDVKNDGERPNVVQRGVKTQETQGSADWGMIDSASFSPENAPARKSDRLVDSKQKALKPSGSKSQLGGDPPSRGFIKKAVIQALNFSPEVGNAMASSTAAKYDIDQVKGQRWPQVKVGTNSPISSFGGGTRNDNASDIGDTSGSVSVTTRIYDFGKTSSTISGAQETYHASEHTIRLTRNQIAFETISGLLELDKYRKEIDVAKAYEARMASLVNMLQQIVQTDVGRNSELVQARSKLLQAKTNVQQIETRWRDTQIKLTRLLGHDVNLPANLKWDDAQVDASSVLSALNDHPQILRAKALVQASLHSADALESSMYPNINWVVAKSSAKDSAGVEQAWYTGINVEWDLFTGGSVTASQKAAFQRAQASRKEFEATVLELKYRIRSMVEQRNSSFARAKDYRALSAETDKVRTMFYEQWYYLGKRSLLDVLTAENDHFNNQIFAINQQFDGYTANVNILAESALLLDWLNISRQ